MEGGGKEERVLLLESWLAMEEVPCRPRPPY